MADMYAPELYWVWAGLGAFGVATFLPILGVARGHSPERPILTLLITGVSLLTVAIAVRWNHLGHGPFVNLYEIVLSQLFSMGLIFTLVYWRMPVLRPTAVVVLPVMWLFLGFWMIFLEPKPSHLPATFENYWLWIHVGVGKVFLGLTLVAVGVAGVILLRGSERFAGWFSDMPDDHELDRLAWRIMLLAFMFHSFMLIAGAVWAQDAWGRYWAWDPLETSSFITWLAIGLALHARVTWRVPIWVGGVLIIVIYLLAFTTFFGIPFLSHAAHKGAV